MPLAACNIMTGAVTARTLDLAIVVLTLSVSVAEMICDRGDREERREGEKEGEMVREEKEGRVVGERGERGKRGREGKSVEQNRGWD